MKNYTICGTARNVVDPSPSLKLYDNTFPEFYASHSGTRFPLRETRKEGKIHKYEPEKNEKAGEIELKKELELQLHIVDQMCSCSAMIEARCEMR